MFHLKDENFFQSYLVDIPGSPCQLMVRGRERRKSQGVSRRANIEERSSKFE